MRKWTVQAMTEEVDMLEANGMIREVHYLYYLQNVFVIKKKNGNNRVFIDLINLDKACPEESFPLPMINRLEVSTKGHEIVSFIDAFSSYNEILMHLDDQ